MKRYIKGAARNQSTLFPAALDDYIGEDNARDTLDRTSG
jgi:hypothetical protein